ncbi:MAG: integrase arm-type DNA-binding domain-containing protein [Hyphomicrobiales bacterium]|nr:integrase arm-type DNA-binding domain-containing protein [Hyphomicrobiales bacterium]
MPNAPLTAAQVADLADPNTEAAVGVFRVDHGLYVQVKGNGARSWLLRYQINGRARQMGLGALRLISLTEAKRRALKAQRLVLDGIDPIEARRAEKAAAAEAKRQPVPAIAASPARLPTASSTAVSTPTFAECAGEYIAEQEPSWRNEKHVAQWRQTLRDYVHPKIGKVPVSDITLDHIVDVLKPIWRQKNETARRLRGRIERILNWAEAHGHRTGANPAAWRGPLPVLLGGAARTRSVQHHKAVPWQQMPAFWKKLNRLDSTSAKALRFLVLTAARTGEVTGARWSEIDLEAKIWTCPVSRMKAGREHRVPLSDAAVGVLRFLDRENDLVFPGARAGASLSNMAMPMVLRGLRDDGATVHGMRSSFSDWASEATSFPAEVREMALAHTIRNRAEAAYRRGDLLEKRRELMRDWARYLANASAEEPD